jgi:hypothetical protein
VIASLLQALDGREDTLLADHALWAVYDAIDYAPAAVFDALSPLFDRIERKIRSREAGRRTQ